MLAVNNAASRDRRRESTPFCAALSVRSPTDNAAQDQVVQYEDVGTKLSIRPTISADGYVMLQVSAGGRTRQQMKSRSM